MKVFCVDHGHTKNIVKFYSFTTIDIILENTEVLNNMISLKSVKSGFCDLMSQNLNFVNVFSKAAKQIFQF